MSKIKISAVSRKEMPSKFGGTWTVVRVKVDGRGDEVFELEGFSQKEKESIVAGKEIRGYFSERSFTGKNGPQTVQTINKITAEYVYDLLMEMKKGRIDSPSPYGNERVDMGGSLIVPITGGWDNPAPKSDRFDDPGF